MAGELQARHAVPGVPERRGGVADDRLAILLDVAQAPTRPGRARRAAGERERAARPAVARLHGDVDRLGRGDGRDEVLGVGQRRPEDVRGVRGGLGRAAGLAARSIAAGLQVEGVAIATVPPVEAAVALAAGVAGGDEALHDVGAAVERLVRVAGRQPGGEGGVDRQHQVEPDQVEQREHAGARRAEGLRDRGVGVLDRDAAPHRLPDRAADPVRAEPVADEARRVGAAHDGLAEPDVAERLDRVDGLGAGGRAGDELQEPQVARRVEEVRHEQVRGQLRRRALGELGERDGRRVGGHDRARAPHAVEAREERALGVGVLDDRLDDPVRVGDQAEIARDVAGPYAPPGRARDERGRVAPRQALERSLRRAWHGVEQHDVEAGVRQVGRDARPHHAGADDGRPARLGHSTASRTVAMPWPPPMHWVATA